MKPFVSKRRRKIKNTKGNDASKKDDFVERGESSLKICVCLRWEREKTSTEREYWDERDKRLAVVDAVWFFTLINHVSNL